jgi:hypothetical protein
MLWKKIYGDYLKSNIGLFIEKLKTLFYASGDIILGTYFISNNIFWDTPTSFPFV